MLLYTMRFKLLKNWCGKQLIKNSFILENNFFFFLLFFCWREKNYFISLSIKLAIDLGFSKLSINFQNYLVEL